MTFNIGEVEVINEVSLAPSAALYDGATTADGDLTIKVNHFYYDIAGVRGKYVGSCGNAVTDDATNYIFLNKSQSNIQFVGFITECGECQTDKFVENLLSFLSVNSIFTNISNTMTAIGVLTVVGRDAKVIYDAPMFINDDLVSNP
jgi:hypothetical protein